MKALLFLGVASCALDASIKDACQNLPLGASRGEVRSLLGDEVAVAESNDDVLVTYGDSAHCSCIVTFKADALASVKANQC